MASWAAEAFLIVAVIATVTVLVLGYAPRMLMGKDAFDSLMGKVIPNHVIPNPTNPSGPPTVDKSSRHRIVGVIAFTSAASLLLATMLIKK